MDGFQYTALSGPSTSHSFPPLSFPPLLYYQNHSSTRHTLVIQAASLVFMPVEYVDTQAFGYKGDGICESLSNLIPSRCQHCINLVFNVEQVGVDCRLWYNVLELRVLVVHNVGRFCRTYTCDAMRASTSYTSTCTHTHTQTPAAYTRICDILSTQINTPAVGSLVHQPCAFCATWQEQPRWCVLLLHAHVQQPVSALHVQPGFAGVARWAVCIEVDHVLRWCDLVDYCFVLQYKPVQRMHPGVLVALHVLSLLVDAVGTSAAAAVVAAACVVVVVVDVQQLAAADSPHCAGDTNSFCCLIECVQQCAAESLGGGERGCEQAEKTAEKNPKKHAATTRLLFLACHCLHFAVLREQLWRAGGRNFFDQRP